MAPIAGFNVQADVNGVPYTFSEFYFDDKSPILAITNSEGDAGDGTTGHVGFETSVSAPAKARIKVVKATFDPLDDPFALPLGLGSGISVAIRMYPSGRASGLFHNFPSVRLETVSHEAKSAGLQPVNFEGDTDGTYALMNQ